MSETATSLESDADWPRNYFNYFTAIEEHFQKARGTGLFLMSPLDWALIESWKNSGVPLEAVLKGVDDAFEKWRSRKQKRRLVNSVAYCTQAVMEAAQRTPASREGGVHASDAPFEAGELGAFLSNAASAVGQRPEAEFREIAEALVALAGKADEHVTKLEDLERHLTVLEEKLVAAVRMSQTAEALYALREKLDRELRPYRGKMTADQLSMLERRYLDTALLEQAKLPRLSLFYLN